MKSSKQYNNMVTLIINEKIIHLTKKNEQRVKKMLFDLYKPEQEIEIRTKKTVETIRLNEIFER